MPRDYQMPFFYSAVSLMWSFYPADSALLERYLEGTGLKPARFNDLQVTSGLVSLNIQNYASLLGNFIATVAEIEFNIHAYPVSQEDRVPDISLGEYLIGQDQTKLVGGFRLHVPANDRIAVEAGMLAFGERKFVAPFSYSVPSPNGRSAGGGPPWECTCFAPWRQPGKQEWETQPPEDPSDADTICTMTADLSWTTPRFGNPSPLTLYSLLPGGPDAPPGNGRLIGSRWNLLGPCETYYPLERQTQKDITLKLGGSSHAMRNDLQRIIGTTAPIAAQVFQSPPAAVENRAYWVDPQ